MSVVSYSGIELRPAPQYSLNHDFVYYDNGEVLNSIFNITLDGQIIAPTGGAAFTGEAIYPSSYFEYNARKVNSLRQLFSHPHNEFIIKDNDDNTILTCQPVSVDIDIPSNYYVNVLNYTINLRSPIITSYGVLLDTEESIGQNLISAQDTVTLESYNDYGLKVRRSLAAKGINTSGMNAAYIHASSWCWDNLLHSSYVLDSFKNTYTNLLNTSFQDFALNNIVTEGSITEGTYTINASYVAPTASSFKTYSVDLTYADDDFIVANVNCVIEGTGLSIADKLQNAQNTFSDPVHDIYNEISSVIPNNYLDQYEATAFTESIDKATGTVKYGITYYVGGVIATSLRHFTASINRDQNYNFQISVHGSYSNYTDSANITIPDYSDIMNTLYNKGMVSDAMLTSVYSTTVTRSYSQENALQSWDMSIIGNEFAQSGNNVMVDIHRTRSIDTTKLMEQINENITVKPIGDVFISGSIFNQSYYDIYNTKLFDKLEDIVKGDSKPISLLFSSCLTRNPAQSVVGITEHNVGDRIIGYDITRNWTYWGWDFKTYLPTNVPPVKNFNININRNFDIHSYARHENIPGRLYGALFQNLQTTNNPTIEIDISMEFARTGILLSSPNLTSICDNTLPSGGIESFVSNISLSEFSDAILKQIVGNPNLYIDKYNTNNVHLDATSVAIVHSESDSWNPVNLQLNYRCGYTLVNMGYR